MEATFKYILRPREAGEEYQLEHTGPPLGLMGDLRLDEQGDVEGIPDQGRDEARRSTSLQVANSVEEDEAAKTALFLSGGGNALEVHRPRNPIDEWPADKTEDMLFAHDGLNVLEPAGLHEWQHLSLDKVCGNQPRLTNDKAFQGNTKITPAQKKELAEHRAEGEKAALAADVSKSSLSSYQSEADPSISHRSSSATVTLPSKPRAPELSLRLARRSIHAKLC